MTASPRVLHVHSGNLYGGVETMLLAVAGASEAGMETSFALCFEGRFAAELRASGAEVHLLGNTRVSRPWTVWQARRRLSTLLGERRPDVTVFHSGWSQAIFGPVARGARLPTVRWMHAALEENLWLERWARRAKPSLFICNSRFTAKSLERANPTAPCEILYPPVPPPPPDARDGRVRLRASLGVNEATTVIALVGRMEALKGHVTFLRALAPMADRRDWTGWIIGGPQRPEEISYLGGLGLATAQLGLGDRIRFLGERTDVRQLLAAADLYCQPNSAPESFGITFVEALYAGLPVVTFDHGGPSEIVDSTCGVLIPPGDLRELAVVLRRLLNDPDERRRLAQSAPGRASDLCDPGIQVARIAKVMANFAGNL